jgi:energy-coupling factor transporter ATP-binding protein EcfA2
MDGGMKLSPAVKKWILEGKFIFIYGAAGTGKSHLALNFANFSSRELSLKACIIATETGTLTLLRRHPPQEGVKIYFSPTLKSMLDQFLDCLYEGRYVVIDTINALHDGTANSYRLIGLISSMSRASSLGVLALGQVREVEAEGLYPAAWQAVIPWAEVVGRTSKLGDKFLLSIEKPRRGIMAFRIRDGEVEWI